MAIKSFSVRNFKGYREKTTLDFSDMMIFSGINNRGKSSLYQALLLFYQSIESTFAHPMIGIFSSLKLNGEYINLGVEKDILSDAEDTDLDFELQFDNDVKIKTTYTLTDSVISARRTCPSFILNEYELSTKNRKIHLVKKGDTVAIEANNTIGFEDFSLRDLLFEEVANQLSEESQEIEFNDIVSSYVIIDDAFNVIFYQNVLRQFSIDFDSLKNCFSSKFRDKINWEDIKCSFIENEIDINNITMLNGMPQYDYNDLVNIDFEYITAFRGYPKYFYNSLEDANPLSYTTKGKIAYDFDCESMEVIEGSYREALEHWIVKVFGLMEDFQIDEYMDGIISQNLLTINSKQIPINHTGFGINQIIPVITTVLFSRSDYIIIDEPEIHLHPSLQSKLADFFFSMSMCEKKLIIETHSEYLIQKMIYLMLLNEIMIPTQSLFWVDCHNDPSIYEIEFDELGFIKNKPNGFIDEIEKTAELLSKLRLKKLTND
jgi:predicted ATPase